jgi:hypothetical protein
MSNLKRGALKVAVEKVLREQPSTRDDDALLTLWVWLEVAPDKMEAIPGREGKWVKARNILDLPKEDHVSRIRRWFQERGQYPTTNPYIARKRHQSEEDWKRWSKTGDA